MRLMASSKRPRKAGWVDDEPDVKRLRLEGLELVENEYSGYSLQNRKQQSSTSALIPIEDGEISAEAFFDAYVAERRPCIIDSHPKHSCGKPCSVSLETLCRVAGDKTVQVEKRLDTTESFGQNRTASRQIYMTISEFIDKMHESDTASLFYLSTQEASDDGPFHDPCRQLLNHHCIPQSIEWAGNLILDACNLWVGKSKDGSSSGLHHDFHDNFYLLLQGRKRFRLYSPDCATRMYTHGRMNKVHFNGLISYVGHETRADGVPVEVTENETGIPLVDSDDEEEEGNGFDFEDDSDCGVDFDENAVDDFDEIMGATGGTADTTVETERPNSFSQIDLSVNRERLKTNFPHFDECREAVVELQHGQTLYLPAGWFHEVTSFANLTGSKTSGSAPDSCHIALNYWYHPPCVLDNYRHPYKSSELLREADGTTRNDTTSQDNTS